MFKYSQYRDFYNQSFTINIRALRGTKIDGKMLLTILGLAIFSFILVSIIAPGKSHIFGVSKLMLIAILTGLLLFISTKIDTANYPFFYFVGSLFQFAGKRFKKRAYVAFNEVGFPEKKFEIDWQIPFRDIVDSGKEIIFKMYPLKGLAANLKGFSFTVQGATRITYNPLTKNLNIKVGRFEQLISQEKVVSSYLPTKLEVGKGEVKFLVKQGKTCAQYTPDI